jgi:hypothetical protein
LKDCEDYFKGEGFEIEIRKGEKLKSGNESLGSDRHEWEFRIGKESIIFAVKKPKFVLAVATCQVWLDLWLKQHKAAEVDYVHGDEVIAKECETSTTVGIVLPAMDKNDLVRTVVQEGVLPRKTFSMGEADEKRFYFEARRIIPETVFFRGDFFRRGEVTGPIKRSGSKAGTPAMSRQNSP